MWIFILQLCLAYYSNKIDFCPTVLFLYSRQKHLGNQIQKFGVFSASFIYLYVIFYPRVLIPRSRSSIYKKIARIVCILKKAWANALNISSNIANFYNIIYSIFSNVSCVQSWRRILDVGWNIGRICWMM